MENKEENSYKELIKDTVPLSYKDVAEDWEKKSKEWYHALIAIEDLPIVLAIPELRIYAWCRCKLVADDKSEGHFHWHGLVHFPNRKLASWKMQCRRAGVKFSSPKNTFKKVICLDHAVGVLRYLACKDGQRVGRRDGDGLVHFPNRKLVSWKMQCRRAGVKFSSPKNTFKKVICLDHAVGVLRYIACKDGQRVGRCMVLFHIHTLITQDNQLILSIVMIGEKNAPMFEMTYLQKSQISLILRQNRTGKIMNCMTKKPVCVAVER